MCIGGMCLLCLLGLWSCLVRAHYNVLCFGVVVACLGVVLLLLLLLCSYLGLLLCLLCLWWRCLCGLYAYLSPCAALPQWLPE